MSKQFEVFLRDLERTQSIVQLFNGQKWSVEEFQSYYFVIENETGKKVYLQHNDTKNIYDRIQYVFDIEGHVVAERSFSNSRLLLRRETRLFSVLNLGFYPRLLEIYAVLSSVDDPQYFRGLRRYWYQEKVG